MQVRIGRSLAILTVLSVLCPSIATAASPGATTIPATLTADLGSGFLIDTPGDWIAAPRLSLKFAFLVRPGATVTDAFHPKSQRPTDLPYTVIEQIPLVAAPNPTTPVQRELADALAKTYQVAFNPPSTAARPTSFKSATVTPLMFDAANRRFTFSVVVKYDSTPDEHVEVAGVFSRDTLCVAAIWSDSTHYAAHQPALIAMRDSLRLGTPIPPEPMSASLTLKRSAQVIGLLLVAALVAVQIAVIVRERRQRREDLARLLS